MKYFTRNIYKLCGFSDIREGMVNRATFSILKRALKNSFHSLTSSFSGLEHPPPRVWVEREKRREFKLLSLQLFRRYKQHLANSAPKWLQMLWAAGAHPLLASFYLHRIYTGSGLKRPHVSDRKHFHSCCIRQQDCMHCCFRLTWD